MSYRSRDLDNVEHILLRIRRGGREPANPFLDPEVGHFCMPELPGFCEANLCIFHSSMAEKFNKQVDGSTIDVRHQ